MKEITITINRADVQYDVDYRTWKIARTRPQETAQAESEQQTDEENAEWLTREIVTALATVQNVTRAYCRSVRTSSADNSLPTSVSTWTLTFQPEQGWRGDTEQLAVFIHEYVVAHCVADWYKMVNPDEGDKQLANAATYIHAVKNEISNVPYIPNPIFRL